MSKSKKVTKYEYDEKQRLIKTIYSNGAYINYEYDNNGTKPKRIINSKDSILKMEYHDTKRIYPNDEICESTYSFNKNNINAIKTHVQMPDKHEYIFKYNSSNRVVECSMNNIYNTSGYIRKKIIDDVEVYKYEYIYNEFNKPIEQICYIDNISQVKEKIEIQDCYLSLDDLLIFKYSFNKDFAIDLKIIKELDINNIYSIFHGGIDCSDILLVHEKYDIILYDQYYELERLYNESVLEILSSIAKYVNDNKNTSSIQFVKSYLKILRNEEKMKLKF